MVTTTRARSRQIRQLLLSHPGSRRLIQLWLQRSPPAISSLSQEIILQDLSCSPQVQDEFAAFVLEFVCGAECQDMLAAALLVHQHLGRDYSRQAVMIGQVAQLFDDLCEEGEFVDLDEHDLLEIIQSPSLFVRYESTVVIAIQRWVQAGRRTASIDCFLEHVHWARWRPMDCSRLNTSSADLQSSVQRYLDMVAPTTAEDAGRYRSLTMAIPLASRVLRTSAMAFRMAACRWEATLQPDSYESAGQQRFYRLRLRLISGPASALPIQIRVRFSGSPEPYYDVDWEGYGDAHDVPVFPINRLGASLSGLVVGDRIQIEFRFEFR